MSIQLHDTLTRKPQTVFAEDGEQLRFYCCGPTVYGPSHIGNFRTFVLQDVFRRIVEVSGLAIVHVRNITDVDDKTIRDSREAGLPLSEFTGAWTKKFHEDCEKLGMLVPHQEPSAVEHIPEQIEMIKALVEKKHAYVQQDGSVYFSVKSFVEYGQLSRLDKQQLRTQSDTSGDARNLADEYDRDTVADFALWKAHKPDDGENAWESPWGKGRPGWHIECSAMSRKYLGDSFDIHGGGIDLTFPHHENEIAQSRCCTGQNTLARHWFHCAHLMVEGQKMSKSLGNLFTLEELEAKGHSAQAVRYALISGHYRQPLNFTFNGLNAAASALEKLERETTRLLEALNISPAQWPEFAKPPGPGFFDSQDTPFTTSWATLANDMNIPGALGALFSAMPFDANSIAETNRYLKALGAIFYALGIRLFTKSNNESQEIPQEIADLAERRWQAKQGKDFAMADTLRDELQAQGWSVKDTKDEYTLKAI